MLRKRSNKDHILGKCICFPLLIISVEFKLISRVLPGRSERTYLEKGCELHIHNQIALVSEQNYLR